MHFVKSKALKFAFATALTYAEIEISEFSAKDEKTKKISTYNQKNENAETSTNVSKNKKKRGEKTKMKKIIQKQ